MSIRLSKKLLLMRPAIKERYSDILSDCVSHAAKLENEVFGLNILMLELLEREPAKNMSAIEAFKRRIKTQP